MPTIRLVVISLSLVVISCGQAAIDVARKGLEYGALGVSAADRAYAPVYTKLADDALQAAISMADYEVRMSGPNGVIVTLEKAKTALLAAENGVDAWEKTGSAKSFLEAVDALSDALFVLRQDLQKLGVPIPKELDKALEYGERIRSLAK